MPAVRIFSLYAAAAVFFDFLLQVTAFVALMSLDAKRQENNRLDVLCCVKQPKDDSQDHMICVYTFMKNYFAEVLLSDYSRPTVVRFWSLPVLIAGFILEINCSKSSGTCSSILGGSFSVCYDANVACLRIIHVEVYIKQRGRSLKSLHGVWSQFNLKPILNFSVQLTYYVSIFSWTMLSSSEKLFWCLVMCTISIFLLLCLFLFFFLVKHQFSLWWHSCVRVHTHLQL